VSTPNLAPTTYYTYWELWEVRSNTTLIIGTKEPFPTLQVALNNIANCRIAEPVYLHLYISSAYGNHTETLMTPTNLDHPFGANISILGDNESNITFDYDTSDGFIVDSGHTFGTISNVEVQSNYNAIHATTGGIFANIDGVNVTGPSNNVGYTGFSADTGGIINAGAITCTDDNNCGCSASTGGRIFVGKSVTVTSANGSGSGLSANNGGFISAVGCSVTGPSTGLDAQNAGVIIAVGAKISHTEIAISANLNSTIDFSSSTIQNSSIYDLQITDSSQAYAEFVTRSGATLIGNDGSHYFTS
jgi:hypothetical protein